MTTPTRPALDPSEPASLLILADWIQEYSPYELSLAATLRWCHQGDRLPVWQESESDDDQAFDSWCWTESQLPRAVIENLRGLHVDDVARYMPNSYELAFLDLDNYFRILRYALRSPRYQPDRFDESFVVWWRSDAGDALDVEDARLPAPLFERLERYLPLDSWSSQQVWRRDYHDEAIALADLEQAKQSLLAWLPSWE